jgi:hypothetical protein
LIRRTAVEKTAILLRAVKITVNLMTNYEIKMMSVTPEEETTCDRDIELWRFELNFSSIMTISGICVGVQYCHFSQ